MTQQPMFARIINGNKNVDALLEVITTMAPEQVQNALPIQQQQYEADCAQRIQTVWQALNHLGTNIELQGADIRVLTAISYISLSEMWEWFDGQCSQPARELSKLDIKCLFETPFEYPLPNTWIHSLVMDVRIELLKNIKESPTVVLGSQKYFSLPDAVDYCGRRNQAAGSRSVEEILRHVEGAVILWLKFPGETKECQETSQGTAKFISVTHSVLKNYDFLYLRRIQHNMRQLRFNLTDQKICLSDIPWEELATELIHHPLAQEQSQEALALHHLVEHLHTISNRPTHAIPQMSANYQLAVQTGGKQGVAQFTESLPKTYGAGAYGVGSHLV